MPDTIANNGTAVPDMSRAAAKAIYPNGGRNRTAARVQAALLRGLVGLAATLTTAVLLFLIGYILVNGIPNLKPSLFAWEYNSENVSLMPALINTLLMTAFSLVIATPLGIFAAIWLVEYAHRGSKLVRLVRLTTETLQGIPSIVYGLFGMLFFVTQLHWGYSLIAGAFTLAIMVLPVIMRTTEEALIAVQTPTARAASAWVRASCAPCLPSYCPAPCPASCPALSWPRAASWAIPLR